MCSNNNFYKKKTNQKQTNIFRIRKTNQKKKQQNTAFRKAKIAVLLMHGGSGSVVTWVQLCVKLPILDRFGYMKYSISEVQGHKALGILQSN